MAHIRGEAREQLALLPTSLDELIPEDHVVRVIELFVEQLDLRGLGFARAEPAQTGRPGYDPSDLLKLYLYGYLHQARSSRRLERECRRNVEVMWLLGRLVPDHKTIAEFRRQHGEGFRAVCQALIRLCRGQGWFGETVAIDGSKVQAVASAKQVLSAAGLARREAECEQAIVEWLVRLEAADRDDTRAVGEPQAEQIRATLQTLKERQGDAASRRALLEELGLGHDVVGEADARVMQTGGGKRPAYNLQTAVDSRSHLIVHHEVVQDAADNRQLFPVAQAARAALGRETLTVVADAGYSNGEQLHRCEAVGITPYVPVNRSFNTHGQGRYFQAHAFRYVPEEDHYRCPAGQVLTRAQVHHPARQIHYRAPAGTCTACPLKPDCTGGRARTVSRHFDEAAFARAQERLARQPAMMALRRQTVEHPFATVKQVILGNGRFLVRGLASVRGEMSLAILAYNLKRLVNWLEPTQLRQALAVP